VHQSLMALESRKAEVVNMEIGRLREATQTMNGYVREEMEEYTIPSIVCRSLWPSGKGIGPESKRSGV
jgi:hypothetical protein